MARGVANLAERERGLLAHVGVGCPSARSPVLRPRARSRIWPERERRLLADVRRRVLQRGDQRSIALRSRIWPSENAACSRTFGLASCSAVTSPSTAAGSRSWPSANTACSRTSSFGLQRRGQRRRARCRGSARARTPPARGRRDAVLERRDQRIDRARVAQLPEREHRLLAHVARWCPSAPRSADRPRARRAAGRGRTPPARARPATRRCSARPAARRSPDRASARARASPSRALPCRCPSAPRSAPRPCADRPCGALPPSARRFGFGLGFGFGFGFGFGMGVGVGDRLRGVGVPPWAANAAPSATPCRRRACASAGAVLDDSADDRGDVDVRFDCRRRAAIAGAAVVTRTLRRRRSVAARRGVGHGRRLQRRRVRHRGVGGALRPAACGGRSLGPRLERRQRHDRERAGHAS